MDVRVSFAQFNPAATPCDVRVGWCEFDPNATPCDVRVGWCEFDPNATPCDVRVSWCAFDPNVVSLGSTTSQRGGGSAGATAPLRVYRNYGGGLKLSTWQLLSGGGTQQFGSPIEEAAPVSRTKREVFRAEYPITGHLQQYLSAKAAAEQRAARVAQQAISKASISSAEAARKQEEQDIMMFMAMLAAMEDE